MCSTVFKYWSKENYFYREKCSSAVGKKCHVSYFKGYFWHVNLHNWLLWGFYLWFLNFSVFIYSFLRAFLVYSIYSNKGTGERVHNRQGYSFVISEYRCITVQILVNTYHKMIAGSSIFGFACERRNPVFVRFDKQIRSRFYVIWKRYRRNARICTAFIFDGKKKLEIR